VSSDCHSISVSYDEYITLQWVSHNLNSIQKTVTQECCTTTIIITQQSHTDNMNWELTEHIIVTATETEERHRAQWVSEKKVTNVIQNNYACTVKTMTTSLRTANFCLLYDLASSMLSLLRLWRRQQKKRRTQKKSSFKEVAAESVQDVIRAERSLRTRWTVFSSLCQH
jgi:hypothetical protein